VNSRVGSECLPADKPWDVVSATRRSSGVAPRACVRVYARVCWCRRIFIHTIHAYIQNHSYYTVAYMRVLVPPNLYIHTYIRRVLVPPILYIHTYIRRSVYYIEY